MHSREGALNLLRDFEGVSEWIMACKDILPEHVEILAKHEVLRTCEGVGKILLRVSSMHYFFENFIKNCIFLSRNFIYIHLETI